MKALAIGAALHLASVALAAQAPGRTVWDGVFTPEQAERGRAHYAAACARCHGGDLEGGMGRSLAGPAFLNKWREQSVADLLEYVSRTMPMGQAAATLPPPMYADIVAYLLQRNELPSGDRELNATSASAVLIVPRTGSTGELPATTLARVVGCLMPQDADRSWHLAAATKPERMKTIDAPASASTESGTRQYALKYVLQSLAPYVGHKVVVVGILMGDGGGDGINVSTVTSLSTTCD